MAEVESKSLPANAYQPLKDSEIYVPPVPTSMSPPEVTWRAVLWGVLLCIVFSVASAYSTLKVGQAMEAAIPISILAIGLARVYKRRSTVLENMIITGMGGASAAVVSGAVFTVPALYILHLDPHPVQTIFICLIGQSHTISTFSLLPFVLALQAPVHPDSKGEAHHVAPLVCEL